MGKLLDLEVPASEPEAVDMAVKTILKAANLLCTAASLAEEGVDNYISAAIRLRDLANSLSPDKPDWPVNVIPFRARLT